MNKIFSFLAGAFCGALVGGVATLFLTPASGEDLRTQADERWQSAKNEARRARDERRQELETQFELGIRK